MNSADWFERAKQVIPGGVNSPVRAFQSVGGTPVYFAEGKGAKVINEEGQTLTDFCGSWGCLFSAQHPIVLEAVQQTAAKGMTFGRIPP